MKKTDWETALKKALNKLKSSNPTSGYNDLKIINADCDNVNGFWCKIKVDNTPIGDDRFHYEATIILKPNRTYDAALYFDSEGNEQIDLKAILGNDTSLVLGSNNNHPRYTTTIVNYLDEKKAADAIIKLVQQYHQKYGSAIINAINVNVIKGLLLNNHNLILHGAPGTGKTYMAKHAIAEALGIDINNEADVKERIGFVQFHPSYDYTDFVEGLRPYDAGGGNIQFRRQDGIFKAFCKRALKEIESSKKNTFTSLYQDLQNDIKNGKIKDIDGTPIFVKNNNIYGYKDERSVGKEIIENLFNYCEENNCDITTRDDAESILKNINSTDTNSVNTISARIVHNLLKRKEPKKYLFVIDEINRGEISKIFGELFFLLEGDYRGGNNNGYVNTQYQNLVDFEYDKNGNKTSEIDVFYNAKNKKTGVNIPAGQEDNYKGFYIPSNVYIVGCMNDIDRSVEPIDFAMKRRFAWHNVRVEDNLIMLEKSPYKKDSIERMKSLNEVIAKNENLGENYQIGPSYFLKADKYHGDYGKLWYNHINGVLKDYLRGFEDKDDILRTLRENFGNFETSNYYYIAKYITEILTSCSKEQQGIKQHLSSVNEKLKYLEKIICTLANCSNGIMQYRYNGDYTQEIPNFKTNVGQYYIGLRFDRDLKSPQIALGQDDDTDTTGAQRLANKTTVTPKLSQPNPNSEPDFGTQDPKKKLWFWRIGHFAGWNVL